MKEINFSLKANILIKILTSTVLISFFIICLLCNIRLSSGDNIRLSRRIELTFQIKIEELPKASSTVKLWIPYPPTNSYQKLNNFKINNDISYKILEDNVYHNKFIYFEIKPKLLKENLAITYDITRYYYSSWKNDPPHKEETSQMLLKRFLMPDKLIPIRGKIAEEAYKVAGKGSSSLEKAQLLYDYLAKSLKYDKSGKGWGRGDAIYMCNFRKGNCTDFHSLFIGEARSLGIPARFIMGLPIAEEKEEGEISGYHCWAEFYIKEKGWIPVDISEASKLPTKRQFYFGRLDANRVQFTMGRDIKLPYSNSKLNFIIYPYVEINGKEINKVITKIYFKNR